MFLFAGAIINVAVAWGCVHLHSDRPAYWGMAKSYWTDGFAHYQVEEQLVGLQQHTYFRAGIGCSLEEFAELKKQHKDDVATRPDFEFRWFVEDRPDDGVELLFEVSSGWPLRSLSSAAAYDQRMIVGATPIRQTGILIGQSPAWPTLFPVIPEYSGFAINTIFYAAIDWLLFFTPGAIRKRVRRKRGQCAACGYSLGGSATNVCPECGTMTTTLARTK